MREAEVAVQQTLQNSESTISNLRAQLATAEENLVKEHTAKQIEEWDLIAFKLVTCPNKAG